MRQSSVNDLAHNREHTLSACHRRPGPGRAFGALFLLALTLIISACAVSPQSATHRERSEALWAEQVARLPAAHDTARKPTLWLLAVGLHDNSKAFEGDVEGVHEAILRINPQAQVLALSNPHLGGDLKRPFGTRENVQRAVLTMAGRMRTGDSVLVFISTHGHVNKLAVAAGNQPYPDISGSELQQLLAPLQPHATGVVVSACHSGSLISTLRAPNRWVMTAAAANRVSFGCNFFGKQTFYVQALLKNIDMTAQGLQRWASATSQTVQEMETAARVSPHSNPQLWVGPAMQRTLESNGLLSFFKP